MKIEKASKKKRNSRGKGDIKEKNDSREEKPRKNKWREDERREDKKKESKWWLSLEAAK